MSKCPYIVSYIQVQVNGHVINCVSFHIISKYDNPTDVQKPDFSNWFESRVR